MVKQSKQCKYCKNPFSTYNSDYPDCCLKCVKKAMLQEELTAVIPKLYRSARIKHLSTQLQDVMHQLNGGGLFLWGVPGTGKTYAMAALARKYIHQGFNVKRVSWSALGLKIRNTFKNPTKHKTDSGGYADDDSEARPSEQDVIKPLLRADKLFIEDVGTNKSEGTYESDFAVRTLERLLDERLEKGLPTFITTNKSIEEIATSFDDRIASRIVGGCKIVKLSGEDRRYCENRAKVGQK